MVTAFQEEGTQVIVEAIEGQTCAKDLLHGQEALSYCRRRGWLAYTAGVADCIRKDSLCRQATRAQRLFSSFKSRQFLVPETIESLPLVIRDEAMRDGFEQSCAQLYSYRSAAVSPAVIGPAGITERSAHSLHWRLSLVIADIRFPGFPSEKYAVDRADESSVWPHIHSYGSAEHRTIAAAEMSYAPASGDEKIGLLPVKTPCFPRHRRAITPVPLPATQRGSCAPIAMESWVMRAISSWLTVVFRALLRQTAHVDTYGQCQSYRHTTAFSTLGRSYTRAMCGIAGFIGEDTQKIERMFVALVHRGPDGNAVYTGANISFGHARLAILDPTPIGDQPMWERQRQRGDCLITARF